MIRKLLVELLNEVKINFAMKDIQIMDTVCVYVSVYLPVYLFVCIYVSVWLSIISVLRSSLQLPFFQIHSPLPPSPSPFIPDPNFSLFFILFLFLFLSTLICPSLFTFSFISPSAYHLTYLHHYFSTFQRSTIYKSETRTRKE